MTDDKLTSPISPKDTPVLWKQPTYPPADEMCRQVPCTFAWLTHDFSPDDPILSISDTRGMTEREVLRFTSGEMVSTTGLPTNHVDVPVMPWPHGPALTQHQTGEPVQFLGPWVPDPD